MKMQKCGWLQHDGGSQEACGRYQQSTQTGNDAIRRPQVWATLPTTIQNQDLVSHQNGFRNDGTNPTGSSKPSDDDNGVDKKSQNVAHTQKRIKVKKLKNSEHLRNSPPTGVGARERGFGFENREVKAHDCRGAL